MTNQNGLTCTYCGRKLEIGESYEKDACDDVVCQDCRDDGLAMYCDGCGKLHDGGMMTWVESEEILICQTCLDSDFCRCEDCGEWVRNYDVTDVGGRTTSRYVCGSCLDSYATCDNCGEWFQIDELHYHDYHRMWYCNDCMPDDLSPNIMDYGYKPEPRFFGEDTLFMGVELEIDGGDRNAFADDVNQPEIYLKEDGSLEAGVEIVSHPCTLSYHLNRLGWDDLVDAAKDCGCKSHDADTCGLHVHVNRDFFGEFGDERDLNIAKVVLLVNRFFESHLVPFSRRNVGQLRWCKKSSIDLKKEDYTDLEKVKSEALKNYDRYVAVNLQNHATIEFRLFRGTLRKETFFATLELVEGLCHFAKTINIDDVDSTQWQDISDFIQNRDAKYFGDYNESRNYGSL